MKVVCYVDGGARPNPGFIGWGGHGYTYLETTDKPIKNHENKYFTDLGYTDTNNKDTIFVTPIDIFTNVGSDDNNYQTNNVAELKAFITTITHLLDKYKDLTDILIKADSSYIRNGVTTWIAGWKKHNWIKQDGGTVINKELWLIIDGLLKRIKDSKINLKIDWVKAHSVSYGNYLADKLATLGVSLSNNKIHYNDGKFETLDYKEYKKLTIDKNPFINFKRLYFNNIVTNHKYGLYYLTDDKEDDDNEKKNNATSTFITRRSSKTSFAVIKLNEPDTILDSIIKKRHSMPVYQEAITVVKLDRLYTHGVYEFVKEYKSAAFFDTYKKPTRIDFIDGTPIAIDLDPPGPVLNAINQFDFLLFLLDNYINKKNDKNDIKYTDITDIFYETTEKKKSTVTELRKEISDKDLIYIDYHSVKIPINTGVDLLPRNNLKRLEKTVPEIILVTWLHEPKLLRYATIIKTKEDIGIWSNIYAGAILLP